jgi:hypothetical protein
MSPERIEFIHLDLPLNPALKAKLVAMAGPGDDEQIAFIRHLIRSAYASEFAKAFVYNHTVIHKEIHLDMQPDLHSLGAVIMANKLMNS